MISLKGSRFLVSCENYESKVFINNGKEYKEVTNELSEDNKTELIDDFDKTNTKQEVNEDIKDGYAVYIDGQKINDNKEIVHLEKKVASGDSYTPMPVLPIVH